ncbi:Something about silencing protein 10 [Pseudolycoriella hygida]|uniref:Something about silencing protein 10 n=1 Tax=Pseudolycoriella hygida TaxID=35572 RepID=A0A9Q0MNH7_9DIPT|nr:Something about silencing protein 10 [Pseudolycoriella hygida]
MVNKIKIDKDDGDQYEPSDSEDDYTEREKKLLKKVRNRKKGDGDDKVAVLQFDDDDEDEDEDDDDFDEKFEGESDFEDENDDGIPDSRAWGRSRKDFYSTDFVDPDYSSYNVKEAELAEQEEEESKAIQLRLAQQLNETDFTLNVYGKSTDPSEKEDTETKTHLKSDLSDLSHRQKVQLFRKDSPEFEGLVQDFQRHLKESQNLLEPILQYVQQNHLQSLPIFDFVSTQNNLILTYCSNVSFYLVLKAQRSSIKNHPLVKRLVQMRQLLLQLEEKYERVIKPQLEKLLQDIREGHEIRITESSDKEPKKSKKLQLLEAMDDVKENDEESDIDGDEQIPTEITKMETDSENEPSDEEEEEENAVADGTNDRRQITYQMSKNKGLTPHRKKELRNPRVKHRNKFRKAIIRRKGAVRTVRKELKKYSGEISGIKATTKKGIKIR